MVVSQNKGTPTPKYYSPYYGNPQNGTPNFGKPPNAIHVVRLGFFAWTEVQGEQVQ